MQAQTLSIRGIHLNFESYLRLDSATALSILQIAAEHGLNTLLVEYGPRFPFNSHPQIRSPLALPRDDVRQFDDRAADLGLHIIPLQQSLAHLEYALGHASLANLRERAERDNLLCPSNPGSAELFKSLAAELIAAHPRSRLFHLGGDEARKIGRCPTCAARVRQEGVGRIYGRYAGDLCRWLLAQDLRPVVWDDTICAHPDALDEIPPQTIIAYWDYIAVADPTPVLIPRMSHAAGGPRVCHDWRWLLPGAKRRLPPIQRNVMTHYSRPVRMEAALGRPFLNEFRAFLGPGFPRFVRALPYLEYYQSRGHDVICCPTGMGNGDFQNGRPNYARFEHNIATHAARAKSNGRALGLITTFWYDMPPDCITAPLIQTARGCR